MRRKTHEGRYVLTKEQRGSGEHSLVFLTIKELETLVKEAKKMKSERLFFKHLSPDVSFCFIKEKK